MKIESELVGYRGGAMCVRRIATMCLVLMVGCGPEDSANKKTLVVPEVSPNAVESAGGEADPGWENEFDMMASNLQLSDDESARLREAFEVREIEISEWKATQGTRLESMEKRMLQAAKSRDLSGVRSAKSKAEPLRDELRALIDKHQDAIECALSADSLAAWAAFQLTTRLTDLMQELSLTPAQIEQIRSAAATVVENSSHEDNPQAAGFLALEREVESQILTAEQKVAYETIKKKNPMRSLR